MKPTIFPQTDTIPLNIRDKVMTHVRQDLRKTPNLIKKRKMFKIIVPNIIALGLIIGIFGRANINQTTQSSQNISGGITATTTSTTTDQSQLLQQKLTETETLLQELDQISEESA